MNLGHGHGSVNDDGGAGACNGRAGLVGAGNNGGKVDGDGGENGNNRGRGSSSGDIGGDAGSDARVGVDIGGADTLEEGNGIRDDGVRLAVGVDALIDVLDEEGVGAEAGSVGVVSAASLEQEGVQARRDDTRARKGLNRGGRDRSSAGSGVDGGSRRASDAAGGGGDNNTGAAFNGRRDDSRGGDSRRLDSSGGRGGAGGSRDDITDGGGDHNLAGTLRAGNRGSRRDG